MKRERVKTTSGEVVTRLIAETEEEAEQLDREEAKALREWRKKNPDEPFDFEEFLHPDVGDEL